MKNYYFLGRLSFSILGFLFPTSQEIGSMEGNADISMVSSSSKSSLGVDNDQRRSFREKSSGLLMDIQNKSSSPSLGNEEDSSFMDCSPSPKMERKRNITTCDGKFGKEYPRPKKKGITPLKIKDIEINCLSSMECSGSPGKDSNLSMPDSLREKSRKNSLDDQLGAIISTEGIVEARNVLAFWMSGSNKFTHIKVRGKMTNEDIAQLCTWKFPTNLKEVDWGQSSGLSAFFQQILRCHWDQSLMVLDLIDEDIKEPIFSYIALALTKNQSLTTLNVHLNSKSFRGNWVEAIVDPLIAHKSLKTIDLSHSWIGGFGNAIAKVLMGNTTVAEFKLSHCALLNLDVDAILQALRKNTTLTGLDLCGNQMGVSGAEKINEVLTQNLISMDSSIMFPVVRYQPQFLKDLNLGSNGFGDKGAEWVATILRNNTVLTALNLSRNKIGPMGIHYLADSLADNTTLRILELQHNEISTGAGLFALQLAKNKGLTKLNLGDNQIAESLQYIAKSLIKNKTKFKNTTLTILDLKNNNIDRSNVKYIVKILTGNTSLTEFDVGKNKFNAQDAMKIIAALSKNSTLTILNLGFYGITMEHVPDVSKILKKNSTLKELNLGEKTPENIQQSINGFLTLNKKQNL